MSVEEKKSGIVNHFLLSDMLCVCVSCISTVKSCCSSGDTNAVGLHKQHLLFSVQAFYSFYVRLINLIKHSCMILWSLVVFDLLCLTLTTRITSFSPQNALNKNKIWLNASHFKCGEAQIAQSPWMHLGQRQKKSEKRLSEGLMFEFSSVLYYQGRNCNWWGRSAEV